MEPVEGLEPPLFVYRFTKAVLSPLSHTGKKIFRLQVERIQSFGGLLIPRSEPEFYRLSNCSKMVEEGGIEPPCSYC